MVLCQVKVRDMNSFELYRINYECDFYFYRVTVRYPASRAVGWCTAHGVGRVRCVCARLVLAPATG